MTTDAVITAVCRAFEISREDLIARGRRWAPAEARGAMYLIAKQCGISLKDSAAAVGRTPQSAVHGLRKATDILNVDPHFNMRFYIAQNEAFNG